MCLCHTNSTLTCELFQYSILNLVAANVQVNNATKQHQFKTTAIPINQLEGDPLTLGIRIPIKIPYE